MQEFWHKRSSPLLTRHCTILALPHGNGLAHADPSLRSAPFLGKMVASTANVHLLNTYISKTRTSPKYVHLQASTANVHLSLAKSISHPIVITKTAVLGGEQLCWFHHHDITVTTLRNKAIGNRLGSLANGYCNLESVI